MKNVWQRIILQDYNVINITKVDVQSLFILGLSIVVQDSYVKNRVNPPQIATEIIPLPKVS